HVHHLPVEARVDRLFGFARGVDARALREDPGDVERVTGERFTVERRRVREVELTRGDPTTAARPDPRLAVRDALLDASSAEAGLELVVGCVVVRRLEVEVRECPVARREVVTKG